MPKMPRLASGPTRHMVINVSCSSSWWRGIPPGRSRRLEPLLASCRSHPLAVTVLRLGQWRLQLPVTRALELTASQSLPAVVLQARYARSAPMPAPAYLHKHNIQLTMPQARVIQPVSASAASAPSLCAVRWPCGNYASGAGPRPAGNPAGRYLVLSAAFDPRPQQIRQEIQRRRPPLPVPQPPWSLAGLLARTVPPPFHSPCIFSPRDLTTLPSSRILTYARCISEGQSRTKKEPFPESSRSSTVIHE